MSNLRLYTIGWLLSALLLTPCMILYLLSGVDLHHRFHIWYYEHVIIKKYEKRKAAHRE